VRLLSSDSFFTQFTRLCVSEPIAGFHSCEQEVWPEHAESAQSSSQQVERELTQCERVCSPPWVVSEQPQFISSQHGEDSLLTRKQESPNSSWE
jgi:hypothetical protein